MTSRIPIDMGAMIKFACVILSFQSGGFALSSESAASKPNAASGGTATDNTCSTGSNNYEYLGLDIPQLKHDIANGRVHQHLDFLTEAEVTALLEQADILREGGAFAASGLSNTNKGKDQDFGAEDRTVSPLPWWKDSIANNHEAAAGEIVDGEQSEEGDESVDRPEPTAQLMIGVSRKLQDLRALLSKELNRPTMADSDTETMAHECYFSRSTEDRHWQGTWTSGMKKPRAVGAGFFPVGARCHG